MKQMQIQQTKRPSMSPDWEKAWALVAGEKRILIACHIQPDGDAIGSMLGLGLCLREQGKTVDMVVDGGLPPGFAFLTGAETIDNTPTSGEWDVFISVDTSDEARTGASGAYGRAHSRRLLNLDHHITNDGYGDAQLLLTTAVSATEIVYRWLHTIGVTLSAPVAQALLTGLVTDTQGFRTDNVKAETLSIAQDLMKSGASLSRTMRHTLNQRSFATIRLWQRVLPGVELEGRVIFATLRQDDWQAVGATPGKDGGLVNLLRQVKEARIAVVFVEVNPKEIKIELRCDAECDVSSVAHSLGGGGHRQASGATIQGNLAEAKARVLPLLHAAAEPGDID